MPFIDPPALARFRKRKVITISADNVDANLSDFPLFVPIDGDTDLGSVCLADGRDVQFTDATGRIRLPFDRGAWSVAEGAATGWFRVLVPTILASTGAQIVLHYDLAGASDFSAPAAAASAFAGLWDCTEDPAGTAPQILDASGNNFHGTINGTVTQADGRFGNALEFDGASGRVNCGDVADLTGNFTLLATINSDGWGTSGYVRGFISKRDSFGGMAWQWFYGVSVSGVSFWFGNSAAQRIDFAHALATGQWHNLALRRTGNTFDLFANGAEVATAENSTAIPSNSDSVWIGSTTGGADATACFDGKIQMAAIHVGALSDAWLKFQNANLMAAGNELTFGAEQSINRFTPRPILFR